MRILVLSPSLFNTGPASRFRIEQWARYLEPRGYQFTFVPFEDTELHECLHRPGVLLRKARLMGEALLRRIAVSLSANRYQLVFLEREAAAIGPAMIERMIVWQQIPLVYDFDEPIWMRYRSPLNSWLTLLKCQAKTATICRLSDRVIVGNYRLAQYASRYSRKVDIVPSTIDLQKYSSPVTRRHYKTITLGWTGSHSTLPIFEELIPMLRRLLHRRTFRLVLIANVDSYSIPNFEVDVVFRRWNASTEAEDLADIDIGLAPFPDCGWKTMACNVKVLQYMAAAIPVVASKVGIVPEYIQDGVSGFLATNENEWLDRIARLIDDPGLRSCMGLEGRKVIRTRYSAEAWAERLGSIFDEIGNTRGVL
jgi:glycosyltransferase involved in cell wall biosynthesis